MRRQVYKKVIEIAPDLKRQIAMKMGCTVDTVYNALNLSNLTTGAQPDRIRRRAMELGGKENRKSAGSIIDAPTSRANENSRKKRSYYKPQRSLPPHRASAQCFARITLTDKNGEQSGEAE